MIVLPGFSEVSLIETTTGDETISYTSSEVTTPPAVVSVTEPEVTPSGTTTVTRELVKLVSGFVRSAKTGSPSSSPSNDTEVSPPRLVPVIDKIAPARPISELSEMMVGEEARLNTSADVAVPPLVVIVIFPVVASSGTVTVTLLPSSAITVLKSVKSASTPLNATDKMLSRFVP